MTGQKYSPQVTVKVTLVAVGCLVLALLLDERCVFAQQLPVRTYTTADGLPRDVVLRIVRDSRGFLWVCTRDGLSRFDGSRFVTYQVGDSAAAPGIEQIIETRKGIYWIVTTAGLYRFDPATSPIDKSTSNERPTLNAEFVDNNRGFLFEDRDGNLWSGGDGSISTRGEIILKKRWRY